MKARKILAGTMLTLATMGAGAATAADLPARVYKAPPMPVAASWTGCYIGVEGGGAWGSSKQVSAGVPTAGLPITNNFGVSGGTVGGTIGCNYQVNSLVLGIENDMSWTNASGNSPDLFPFNRFAVSHTNQNWLDTLRGRFGYSFDRALIYGTAGAAFAGTSAVICNAAAGICGSDSQSRTGWVAGGGVEFAVWKDLSLKLEYLHADFGSARYFNTPVHLLPTSTIVTRDVRLSDDLVRVGLNWRFTSLSGMSNYP